MDRPRWRAAFNGPSSTKDGLKLSLTEGNIPAAKGSQLTFEAKAENIDSNGTFTWTIPVTDADVANETDAKTSTRTVTANNVGNDQTVKVTFEPSEQNEVTGTATATMDVTVVELASLKAEDTSDPENSVETTDPTDPQTLYLPYTEDENEESTTKITLQATPEPSGEFPASDSEIGKKPDWTVKVENNGNWDTVNNITFTPDETTENQYQATLPELGTYEITAECGNELTIGVCPL